MKHSGVCICGYETPLVADEKDIDKVFENCSKVVAVHSEDEEVLNKNKSD